MALSDSPAHATMGRFPAQSHLSEKTSVSRDQGFVKSSLTLQIAAMSSSDLRARMDGLEGEPADTSARSRSAIVHVSGQMDARVGGWTDRCVDM